VAGAAGFLDWARPRFGLVLATNPVWTERITRQRLEWAGVPAGIFSRITHAESMHSCKPGLAYYQEILDELALSPKECLMIGDSRYKDGPAARLGIRVALVGGGAGPLRRLSKDGIMRGSFEEIRRELARAVE
jgi:FMN phosphatase YigB (HAD superfamily)